MINNTSIKPKLLSVLITFMVLIFVIEVFIMLLFSTFEISLRFYSQAFVDAFLLVSISFPVTFYWILKPYRKALNITVKKLENYKSAVDQHISLVTTDHMGTITNVNDLFCQISEFNKEELIGNNLRLLNSGHHDDHFWKDMYQIISSGNVWKGHILNKAKSGGMYWVDTTIVPILDDENICKEYIAIRTDITEINTAKRLLFEAEKRTHLATETSKIGIWEWNLETNTVFYDKQMFAIYGLEPTVDSIIFYEDWRKAVLTDDLAEQEAILSNTAQTGGESERTFRIRRTDNKIRVIHAVETVRFDADGKPQWLVGTNLDVTESVQAKEEIQQLAMTDHLTGLANRRKFYEQFDKYAELSKREKFTLTLMLIDLDNFKTVNDLFGHLIGDKLLKIVADILRENSRNSDVTARFGGDEFAILMVNSGTNENIEVIAQRIINTLSTPMIIEDKQIKIGASIGIATYPKDGTSLDKLMHQADIAMYTAKEQGRNRFCFTPHS